MEIKDVNSLTNLIMSKSAQSNNVTASDKSPSVAMDFMNLLNKKDFGVAGNQSQSLISSRADDKAAPVRNKVNKSKENYNAEAKSNDKAVAKDSSREDAKIKNKPTKDYKPQNNEAATEKPENVTAENPTTPSEDVPVISDDGLVAQTPSTPVEEAAKAPEASEVADDKLVIAPEMIVSVEQLLSMGSLTVFNASTNSYSVITGADLASQLQSSSDSLVPVFSTDGKSDISLLPVSNLIQPTIAEDTGFDISAMTPVLSAEDVLVNKDVLSQAMLASKPANKNIAEANNIPTNADEIANLTKAISDDNNVEIKVAVTEEKISYAPIKENFAAKTILQSAETESTETNKLQASSAQASAPQPTAGQPTAQQLNLFNFTSQAQAQTNVAANDKVNIASAQAVSEITTTTQTQTGVVADMAQTIKTDAKVETNAKMAFRDVYKGLGKEAVEQIKVNITKSAVKGVDNINVQLKPEELGHIEIKMQISKDGKLQAHIISSRQDTMDMLQKEMPSLEKAFSDAGFDTDNGSFSFSFRENQQQANNQEDNNHGLRNFLGNVLEKDVGNENINADLFASENWDGKSALNIRV